MDIDHTKVYVTKQVGDRIECYNRRYVHLGTTGVGILIIMGANHKVTSEWPGWTGGLSGVPGMTWWWDTYE